MQWIKIAVLLLLASIECAAYTDSLFVEESEETWFVTVKAKGGQTALELAREYNTPSTLFLNYNNIDADKVFSSAEYIDIPLNEVNFYKNISIQPQEKEFMPLFYRSQRGDNIAGICNKYQINSVVLKKWNSQLSDNIPEKTSILIGWLKIGNPELINDYQIQALVASNKTDKNEDDVLFESNNDMGVSAPKSDVTDAGSPDLDEKNIQVKPATEVEPANEVINVNAINDSANLSKRNTIGSKLSTEVNKLGKNIKKSSEKISAKVNKPNLSYKKDMNYAIKTDPAKASSVKTSKPTKTKISFSRFFNSLTKKNKTNSDVTTEPVASTNNAVEDIKNDEVLYEDTSTTAIYSSQNEQADEEPKVIIPISQNKSFEGKCGFLYSGVTNGQYYAFVNGIGKGSVINVSYQGNTIRAKVMGNLDTKEVQQGYSIMLSDNAKRILKIKTNSALVKIDY